MASAERSHNTKQKLLQSAIHLFLERGYHKATLRDISRDVGVTTGSIFAFFSDKEALLRELVGYVFAHQFNWAEKLVEDRSDPQLLYGVETAIQMHVTELSENLRDVYVMAYSLPSTSELIYQSMAKKLQDLFSSTMPGCEEKDFYELEIASGSITRGFMARKCDLYFTIDRKVRRYLDTVLYVYHVPDDRRKYIIDRVLAMPLHDIAAKLIEGLLERASDGMIAATK